MKKIFSVIVFSMLAFIGAVAANVKVYFENTGGWTVVNCYSWTGKTEHFGSWPGKAVTDTEVKDGKTLYVVSDVPEDASIIFNGSGGQTADLPVKGGYVYNPGTKAEDVSGSQGEGEATAVYLRTEADGFGYDDAHKFAYKDGVYTITVASLDGAFKIASSDWKAVDYGGNLTISSAGSYNMTWAGGNMTAQGLTNATLSFKLNKGAETTLTVTTSGGGDDPVGIRPTGTLPVIYITTDDIMLSKDLQDKEYRAGTYWIDANGVAGFENVGSAEAPLALEIKARGNYTRTAYSKKPFKLKLGKKANLLGLSKSKHFALLAHADDDKGYLKNFVGFNLGQRIGLTREAYGAWTPSEQPVELVINGDYRGLYFLTESIRVGEDRIPVGELADQEGDAKLCSGPYLIELDNYEEGGDQIIMNEANPSTPGAKLIITPDKPEFFSDVQRRFITEQFSTMNELVGAYSDELWQYLDLDAAARYYIAMEIIDHWESYHGSTYLFRDYGEGKKWVFSPMWDCGNAFTREYARSYFTDLATFGNNWINQLRNNTMFMDKVRETFVWFWGTQVDGLMDDIETYVNAISAAAVRDRERWGNAPLPVQYVDNHGHTTNPQPVADNSNMFIKKGFVIGALKSKIEWLSEKWGTPSSTASEPARDTTPAAPLPSYVDPNPEEVTVYYMADGVETARIWIWDAAGSIYDNWYNRPTISKGVTSDGKTYFYHTFNIKGLDKTTAKVQFTGADSDHMIDNAVLIPGALYTYTATGTYDVTPDFDPNPVRVSGTLPVLYINTADNVGVTDTETKVAATAWLDPKDTAIAAVGSKSAPVTLEIKGRGTSTWNDFDKKPYKLKFDKKQVLISGVEKSKHYVLLPWAADAETAFLRNIVGNQLSRMLFGTTVWTPSEAPVEVVLDGDYIGLYFVCENIRPAGARVPINDIGDFSTAVPESWVDWIVEIDNTAATADVTVDGVSFVSAAPEFSDPLVTDAHKLYLANSMKEVCDAMNGTLPQGRAWTDVIDAEALVNYYILQELMDDTNSFKTSCYLYQGAGGKWTFGPVWDFAAAFSQGGHKNSLIHEADASLPLIGAMYADPIFRSMVANRFFDFTTASAPEGVQARAAAADRFDAINGYIDSAVAGYRGALALDAERWPAYAAADADEAAAAVKSHLESNRSYLAETWKDNVTGIGSITVTETEDAVYYDIYGRRVAEPSAGGIYIERRGTSTRKVCVK